MYKEKFMASSIFWWYLAIREGNGIHGIVWWCSGILLKTLPCMIGILGPYMASDLLMPLVVIGQFLIWFFWMASFQVGVYGHHTYCCNILASSTPLTYS